MILDVPVYIVSRTRQQAVHFAGKLELEPGDWIYLDSLHRVKGVDWFRYIIVPGQELSDETKEVLRKFGAEYVGQRQIRNEKLLDRSRRSHRQRET